MSRTQRLGDPERLGLSGPLIRLAVYIGLAAATAWMLRRFSRVPLEADGIGAEDAV